MTEALKLCENCGAPLTTEGRFCSECGQAALAQLCQQETAALSAPIVVTVGPRVAVASTPRRGPGLWWFAAPLIVILIAGAIWWPRHASTGKPEQNQPPEMTATAPAAVAGLLPTAVGAEIARTATLAPSATSTANAPDPAVLLGAAQKQLSGLQVARFTFQRTAFGARSIGRGWLRMPDRAEYSVTGEAPDADWRVIGREQWTRRGAGEEWARGISSVALVHNPAIWLQLLTHTQEPRLLPSAAIGGSATKAIAFTVALASPGDVDAALTALTGQGIVYLRQSDDAPQRLVYELSFTATRGETSNQELQVSIDLSDWNAALPAITDPSSSATASTPAPPEGTVAPSAASTLSDQE